MFTQLKCRFGMIVANGTVDRHWSLTETGISGFIADVTFGYDDADITGGVVEANMVAARQTSPGINWQLFPGTLVDTVANEALVVGVTTLSDWTLGDGGSIPVELSIFATD